MNNVDLFFAAWFGLGSVVTFLVFGFDKWRAGRAGDRVSEWTLVLLGALGGWVGGLIGMKVFRHKTIKGTFQLKYALALGPFIADIWAWWHWR